MIPHKVSSSRCRQLSLVALVVPLLLMGCEAKHIWSPFMVQSNTVTKHGHQPAASTEPDLCSSLLSNMKRVNKGTPDTCKPLQDKVSGVLKKFCTSAAAEMVNACTNGQDEGCLGDAIQGASSSNLLSGCLCHGYLDVYASLWTTWKLMCKGSAGNSSRGGRWDDWDDDSDWDSWGSDSDDDWGSWDSDSGDDGWVTVGGDSESDCSYSKSDHTMNMYSGPSSSCSSKTMYRELSESAKAAILDKHNELRRKVAKGEEWGQPAAANMKKMYWNTELETVAQRWADQCDFGHDDERCKDDGTSVGQNVFWSANSERKSERDVMSSLIDAAQGWYDEVTDPGYSFSDPWQSNYGTGHYTQLVWAESDELGCGMVYYEGGSMYETIVVCNYAVHGNFKGRSMYKEGSACSMCPDGYGCEDGLCV